MKKRNEILFLASVPFLYIALFMLFLPFFKHQINPDSISLINISLKYLHGEFSLAVNGYWPPLISWLLTIFIFIFKNPVFSFKMLSLFIGLFALYNFYGVLKALKFEFFQIIISLYTAVIGVLYFSLTIASSDLLTASLILAYLSFALREDVFEERNFIIKAAVIGFLLYISKTYGFFFFLAHFTTMAIIEFIRRREKKSVALKYLVTMILFILLSLMWIIPISMKYHTITVGTTGKYNYACYGPDEEKIREPYIHALPLPDSMSTSNWDDPSLVYNESWSPIDSKESFTHQLKLLRKNIPWYFDLMNSFSYLSLLIFAGALLFFFKKRRRRIIAYLIAAVFYSGAGYLMIAFEQRYLWVNYFLLIALSVLLLNILVKNIKHRNIALLFVLATFLLMPAKNIYSDMNANKDIYDSYQELKQYGISGNTASDSNRGYMTILSFYLNCSYYGAFGRNISSDEFKAEIDENKIDYYFIFGENDSIIQNELNPNFETYIQNQKFRVLKRINE